MSYEAITSNPTATTSYLSSDGNAIDGAAGAKSSEEILDSLKKQELVVTDTFSSNIVFPVGQAGTIGNWVVENPSTNNVIQQAEVYHLPAFCCLPERRVTMKDIRTKPKKGAPKVLDKATWLP